MIKELLEQYDEKYNEIIEQTINAKKNILIEKNEQEIDLNKLATMYDDQEEENEFFLKKRNTTANILQNNIKTIKPLEKEELEEELNNIKRINIEEKDKIKNELNIKIDELNSDNKKLKLKLEENDIKNKNFVLMDHKRNN